MSHTLNDKLASYLEQRPGQWIGIRELQRVAGIGGWRTRISQLRRRRQMTIENRQPVVRRRDGTTYKRSQYRYLPEVTA